MLLVVLRALPRRCEALSGLTGPCRLGLHLQRWRRHGQPGGWEQQRRSRRVLLPWQPLPLQPDYGPSGTAAAPACF